MAEGKKFSFKLPSIRNVFKVRQKRRGSFLRDITSEDKRRYPAVGAILSSGCGEKEYLKTAVKMYIYFVEEYDMKDIEWHGDTNWKLIYLLDPTRNVISVVLLDEPVSPYQFWNGTEAIRIKHVDAKMDIFVAFEGIFLVRHVFPYGEYSQSKYGDYKLFPPDEKLPMDEFLKKFEGQIMHPQWLDSAVRVGPSKGKASPEDGK